MSIVNRTGRSALYRLFATPEQTEDLARLHRRLLEPLQQRRREHVVGHHQDESLMADPITRRQRRPFALAVRM